MMKKASLVAAGIMVCAVFAVINEGDGGSELRGVDGESDRMTSDTESRARSRKNSPPRIEPSEIPITEDIWHRLEEIKPLTTFCIGVISFFCVPIELSLIVALIYTYFVFNGGRTRKLESPVLNEVVSWIDRILSWAVAAAKFVLIAMSIFLLLYTLISFQGWADTVVLALYPLCSLTRMIIQEDLMSRDEQGLSGLGAQVLVATAIICSLYAVGKTFFIPAYVPSSYAHEIQTESLNLSQCKKLAKLADEYQNFTSYVGFIHLFLIEAVVSAYTCATMLKKATDTDKMHRRIFLGVLAIIVISSACAFYGIVRSGFYSTDITSAIGKYNLEEINEAIFASRLEASKVTIYVAKNNGTSGAPS